MTRLLAIAVAAVAAYQAVAVKTHRVPPITRIVHEARRHFRPHCAGCRCVAVRPLVPQTVNRHPAWPTRGPR